MPSEVELLQGARNLILVRALETMGPQHAYSLAARLEQVSQRRLTLKQGTRYLEQMLFDLTPLDPGVFIATPLVLASAVLGAALLSVRPALTVAPLAALRHE